MSGQSDQAPLAPKTKDDQVDAGNDIKESDLSPAEMQLFKEFNDTGDEQISEFGESRDLNATAEKLKSVGQEMQKNGHNAK